MLKSPFAVSRIMPGMRKLLKGEWSSKLSGICSILPEESAMSCTPPITDVTPRKTRVAIARARRIFMAFVRELESSGVHWLVDQAHFGYDIVIPEIESRGCDLFTGREDQ